MARKPDLVLINRGKKICYQVDFATSAEHESDGDTSNNVLPKVWKKDRLNWKSKEELRPNRLTAFLRSTKILRRQTVTQTPVKNY